MDTAQWPQEGSGVMQVGPMEGDSNSRAAVVDHQRNNNIISNKPISAPRPQKPQAINCPRCNSTHTKFCYYNNYSLSQPRYFCKTCRRYWTEGGSLRSVPVGGGSRKNKRSSSSILSKKLPHETIGSHQNPNIKIYHEGTQDLNLAYPPITNPIYNLGMSEFADQFPDSTISSQNNFSQFLKSGISGGGSRGFSSFMSMIPDSNGTGLLYSASTSGSSGLPFQEFNKTSRGINFSLNQQQGFDNSGNQGGYAITLQGVNSTATNHPKLFNFPFEDLKQPDHVLPITSTAHDEMIEQNGRNTHRHGEGDDHLQSSGLIWNNGGGLGRSSTGASCTHFQA